MRCELPVLELEGQFAKLDSFYIENGEPPPESAGYWHVSCLRESSYGETWYRARLRNFTEVRGYQRLADTNEWTVLVSRTGERFALSRYGDSV